MFFTLAGLEGSAFSVDNLEPPRLLLFRPPLEDAADDNECEAIREGCSRRPGEERETPAG